MVRVEGSFLWKRLLGNRVDQIARLMSAVGKLFVAVFFKWVHGREIRQVTGVPGARVPDGTNRVET